MWKAAGLNVLDMDELRVTDLVAVERAVKAYEDEVSYGES